MKIEVQNNVPGVKVSINQNCDGSCSVLITQIAKKNLGSVKPGEIVTIGSREYIVLGHTAGTTALITNAVTKTMVFGRDSDYEKSDVREYCNGEFYKELCKAVGKYNIIPHAVDLTADDGSDKGHGVTDNVSILTKKLYRRYREFIPAIGYPCWTATRAATLNKDYTRYVCFISSHGFCGWDHCEYDNGVRPYCILNSSLMI